MDFLAIQFIEGLAGASSLFLVAAGLSLIFGVSRIVNFAHGAFYMLGAYVAASLTAPLGFWLAVPAAALLVGLLGLVVELGLLRRLYGAPELFQLLATFALTLMIEDAVPLVWGPDDILGPRVPGLKGSVTLLGRSFPAYDLALASAGPLVMGGLWLLLKKTRFGILLRAAASDREIVSTLGVDQKVLFSAVFALGSVLAALGGALELPRMAIHPNMSGPVVVSAFVVVVVGGMGSLPGAFLAALLIGEMSAFGVVWWPKATLVLMFAVMALVLLVRPEGLMGRKIVPAAGGPAGLAGGKPGAGTLALLGLLWAGLALMPLSGDGYAVSVAGEILVMGLFAASLWLVTGLGGMTSFGQAAWFGIGAYAVALVHPLAGMAGALGAALGAGFALGGLLAFLMLRHGGITFAMLTLAAAAIVHSVAVQAYGLTGGDNGLLGIWPDGVFASPAGFHLLVAGVSGLGFWGLARLAASPFGAALRAVRDAPVRASAIGIGAVGARAFSFALASGLAALAGGLFAYLKGSVFPDVAAISVSVDALAMALLGGMASLAGPLVGAGLYTVLKVGLSAHAELWRMVVGMVLIVLVLAFPGGLLGRKGRR